MGAIRVLIADDEPHIRALLKAIVQHLGGEVVAECADGDETLRVYAQLHPDLLLLDINMPRVTGESAMEQILGHDPNARIIMLTAQDSADTVRRCIDLGARDYILKNNPAEEILRMLGESWAELTAELGEGAKP